MSLSRLEKKIILLSNSSVIPEDVFDCVEELKQERNELLKQLHPDVSERKDATELSKKVSDLYDKAVKRVEKGIFGERFTFTNPIVISSEKKRFELVSKLTTTASAQLFKTSENKLFYLANNTAENKKLKRIAEVSKSLGKLKETHLIPEGEFVSVGKFNGRDMYEQEVSEGYHPLARLIDKPVPLSHLAWMFNRLINCIAALNQHTKIHTNLNPDTFLINTVNHTGMLVGLESVEDGKVKIAKGKVTEFMPPEQITSGVINSTTNLFAAAKMIEKLAEPVATKEEWKQLAPLLQSVTNLGIAHRLADPIKFSERLRTIWKDLYGPSKFKQFETLNISLK